MKISVHAHPSASQPKIEKNETGVYHVYVKEPASKNKANKAIIKALADYFSVSKNQVFLDIGSKQRDKVFTILKEEI